MANYLTFSSPNSFTLKTVNSAKNWDGTLEYSTDASVWNVWDGTTTLSADNGKLYLRGVGNTIISGYEINVRHGWLLDGTEISCDGNIENLLDYATVENGEHPTMGNYCYHSLFRDCTGLVKAPELLAENVRVYDCYSYMFYGCTSLIKAPSVLPAKYALGYEYMFAHCTSLKEAPELPATGVGTSGYSYMFYGCTSLIKAPSVLPAKIVNNYSYSRMFCGCTSLTKAPAILARTIGVYGCWRMFEGCTNLTTLPALYVKTMTDHCYNRMFSGCSNIKVSGQPSEEYKYPYRIPIEGEGIDEDLFNWALDSMFENTGGIVTGSAYVNQVYYTSNEVIYAPEDTNEAVITYGGKTIANLEAGQTATVKTAQTEVDHDIIVKAAKRKEFTLQKKTATANGVVIPDIGFGGLSMVVVDVKPKLQEKTATANGEYISDTGYDGLSKVIVKVPEWNGSYTYADGTFKFTIDGTEFQAEKGMTWSEWVESEYNIYNYFIEYNTVYVDRNVDGTPHSYIVGVVPTDVIIANNNYEQITPSHSGGGSN